MMHGGRGEKWEERGCRDKEKSMFWLPGHFLFTRSRGGGEKVHSNEQGLDFPLPSHPLLSTPLLLDQ